MLKTFCLWRVFSKFNDTLKRRRDPLTNPQWGLKLTGIRMLHVLEDLTGCLQRKGCTPIRGEAMKANFINIIILCKADSCTKPLPVCASHTSVCVREALGKIYLFAASCFFLHKSLKNLRIILSSQSQRNNSGRRATTVSENTAMLYVISIKEDEKRKRPC